MLLRDLTWRKSLRPLFAAVGMESYSDQLEQMVKDVAGQQNSRELSDDWDRHGDL